MVGGGWANWPIGLNKLDVSVGAGGARARGVRPTEVKGRSTSSVSHLLIASSAPNRSTPRSQGRINTLMTTWHLPTFPSLPLFLSFSLSFRLSLDIKRKWRLAEAGATPETSSGAASNDTDIYS